MVGKRGKDQYNQDLIVLSLSTLLVFMVWAAMDLSSGPSEYFMASWGPPDDGGGGGNGGEPVEPVIEEEVLVSETGYNDEGTSTDLDFEVPWTTTLELVATLEWDDDVGNNDELMLTVLMDGEEIETRSGTSGTLGITIKGPSEGNYSIMVQAVDCPGIVSPLPVGLDGGNDWALEVRATYEVMA